MGRGNVCVTGPCEGLYYIDNKDLYCYHPMGDEYWETDDSRLLRSVSYEDIQNWEYDDLATQWWIDDVLEAFVESIKQRFSSFESCDEWLRNGLYGRTERHAILENRLFYIALEDNEWSLAVELIQKEDPYDNHLEGLQKRHFQGYLDGIRDSLFEQFETLGIRAGAWTSGTIRREEAIS